MIIKLILIHIKKPRRGDIIIKLNLHLFEVKVQGIYRSMLSRKRQTIQEFVAVNDTFGESATPAELMKKYGIDSDAVQAAVKRIMNR